MIEYRGEVLSIAEWERRLGFAQHVLVKRLARGLSVEEAFSRPVGWSFAAARATPVEERFFALTREDPSGCLLWVGAANKKGYGHFKIRVDGKLLSKRATHCAFFFATGRWPATNLLRHDCDNPPCVRFEHLVESTQQQNIEDALRKGRMAMGERNGSAKLSDAQAEEIRSLYSVGDVSQVVLAARFDVSQVQVSRIVRGASRV